MRMIASALLFACASSLVLAEEPAGAENPRLMEVIRRCAPAQVDISGVNTNADGTAVGYVGSGSLIQESGYILTNAHVVGSGNLTAHLQDGSAYKCRVVGKSGADDLAVLKIDREAPFPVIPLGRNDTLELGETAIVLGNPNGLSHTVSTGIVSRLAPGYVESGHIQITAAVNGGNSGGPLLNGRGELIGVITLKGAGEAIGLAIPVDRVRKLFAGMTLDEAARGWRLGLAVDPLSAEAVVAAADADSPAAKAGLGKGDVLLQVGGKAVRSGVDFCLFAGDSKPGDPLVLQVRRNGKPVEVRIEPELIPLLPAESDGDFGNGVRYEVRKGSFAVVNDIASAKLESWGFATSITASPAGAPDTLVGLVFEGFISVPADGAWTFFLESDDGSRFWIGQGRRTLIDNDGPHGSIEKRGTVRLEKGRHEFAVVFFQGGGPKALKLSIAGPGVEKREIPAEMLWVRK